MRLQLVSVLSVLLFSTAMMAPAQVNLASDEPATAQSSQPKSTELNHVAPGDTDTGPKTHMKLGMITVGAGFVSGPAFYPYYPYSPFGPYSYYPHYALAWWNPGWHYDPANLAYGGGKGELELKADRKDAELYIDGAYAGTVERLKRIWLDPGAYNISVSAAGRKPFERRIYVLSGKTLSINAKLLPLASAVRSAVRR